MLAGDVIVYVLIKLFAKSRGHAINPLINLIIMIIGREVDSPRKSVVKA